MSVTQSNPHVWVITGTSQGFGRDLVDAVLQRGDRVIATSRDSKKSHRCISQCPRSADRNADGLSRCQADRGGG